CMIVAADEQLHEPGADAHWPESYYFNWADSEGRSFGLTRIGYNPAARKIDAVLLPMRDRPPEDRYPALGLAMIGDVTPPPECARLGRREGLGVAVGAGRRGPRVQRDGLVPAGQRPDDPRRVRDPRRRESRADRNQRRVRLDAPQARPHGRDDHVRRRPGGA